MARSGAKESRARLGAHMSIEGGLARAVDRAAEVGATALQLFVKSARQWVGPPLAADSALRFRERLAEAGLGAHTLAHASYLINLATPDAALRERSVSALADELERCDRLGIPYLVLHPGSHLGDGVDAGLERVARAIDRALARPHRAKRAGRPAAGGVTLLLETTAGQGTNLGHAFEHLAWLLGRVKESGPLGICFDSCHVHAAGYDIRHPRSYAETMAEFDRVVGLSRLAAFHLNDSQGELGSRRDRHEAIGRGKIGKVGFRSILNDARFHDLPMVLETPKPDGLAADRRNLAALRAMLPRERR